MNKNIIHFSLMSSFFCASPFVHAFAITAYCTKIKTEGNLFPKTIRIGVADDLSSISISYRPYTISCTNNSKLLYCLEPFDSINFILNNIVEFRWNHADEMQLTISLYGKDAFGEVSKWSTMAAYKCAKA